MWRLVMKTIRELDEPPALVIFDTVARNMGPADENSTQDMTGFVRACDEIRTAWGCTVSLSAPQRPRRHGTGQR
jgi:RecA-family ATPase